MNVNKRIVEQNDAKYSDHSKSNNTLDQLFPTQGAQVLSDKIKLSNWKV